MDELYQTENRSPVKKAIVPLMLLALLSALFYYKDSFLGEKKANALAEVTAYQNDVRVKDSKSIDFTATKTKEQIYHGDSLSTGGSSSALVTFKTGQVLNVDQNSLIIFDELTDTPEFVKGNVKVTVTGKMKLKVDNEVIEVDGGNTRSDLQIYRDEKAKTQKIVLLQGEAHIKSSAKKEIISLQKNIPVEPKKVLTASELLKNTHQPASTQSQPTQPVMVARPPMPTSGNYKLYDYYSRMLSSNTELDRNRSFTLKPNFKFENFTPATLAVAPQPTESTDPMQNPYTVRVIDPTPAQGYVFEVSKDSSFVDGQTQYNWKNSYFTQNFSAPGNYFVRYRKVLNGQALSDYSPTEMISVPEKPKPVVVQKPEPVAAKSAPVKPVKKVEPLQKSLISKQAAKPKPVVKQEPVAKQEPVVKKETLTKQEPVIERKPTAVPAQAPVESKSMQSTTKIDSNELHNQNYNLSNVEISAGQALMVSGQQLANSNQVNTSYGLQVSGLYWMDQNGFRASYGKALSSTNSVNLVSQAEFDYLRRFTQSWALANGGSFQYYASIGIESYQNSQATSDFVDSYNLYKLGVGASMPIFNFWSIDGHLGYGFGDSKRSSIFFATRANFFLTKKLSLGIGFRARKYEYYLLDQKNYESLAETYTVLSMYY